MKVGLSPATPLAKTIFRAVCMMPAYRNYMKFLRLFATAVATVACATIAPAYVLEGPSWSSGSVTFQLRLGTAGRTLTDGNTSWDVAAQPGVTAWNANMGSLQLIANINPSASLSSGDGINTIGFSSTANGQSFGSSTLAITLYRYSGSRMSEADIYVNTKMNWDSYRGSLRYGSNTYAIGDVQRVLIHEVGHAIGLNHPDQHGQNVEAIMNSMVSNRYTVSSDDIRGSQSLYGTGQPAPTPTPTPSPSPSPSPTPNPSQPRVSVTVAPGTASMGNSAIFTITLAAVNQNAPTTVSYSMSGSAVQGTLYSLSPSGQVTIPAGASSANVTLTVLKRPKRGKTAVMNLGSSSTYTVSAPTTATITITR
jgi:hypothetical protein